MTAIRVFALLIYTSGAFAYGALIVLSLREWWGSGGTQVRDSRCATHPELDAVGAALQLVSFVWFIVLTAITLVTLAGVGRIWQLNLAHAWLAYFFPPLIMHITFADLAAEGREPRGRIWRVLPWLMYVTMQGSFLYCTLGFLNRSEANDEFFGRLLVLSLSTGFILSAIYAMVLGSLATRPSQTVRKQQSIRWEMGLFLLLVVFFGIFIYMATRTTPPPLAAFLLLVQIGAQSLPLAFLFVAAYFENRFEFFDLFVKRGLSLFLTIAVMTGAFALLTPLARVFDASPAAPLLYSVVFLPVIVALPWLYGLISATLDRRWLGRRFTTVEAVKRFVAGLRSATTESQLIEGAERGLTEIFDAPAMVELGTPDERPAIDVVQEISIRPGTASIGRILMGQRVSEAPYFSEDLALLASLADVLASVLDNLRLQRREQEQDQLARELSLHASRSELKALRAQINPHFLFNALNAIAGLIHKDPAVADRTIEQLADVFRYALRGGENEWALLDEELEFVRSYLEVERARFGSRLNIDVRLDDDVRGARVPTMMVQTLVENAVKHGVALVRGPASVEVHARRDGGQLVITVADSGPGFPDNAPPKSTFPWSSTSRHAQPHPQTKSGGYGLANIRQRLEGYFGSNAALTVSRDAERRRTIVSVSLPLELHVVRHTAARESRS